MSSYAMKAGLRVPAFVLQIVASTTDTVSKVGATDPAGRLSATQFRNLTHAHDQLAHVVAPARPGTLAMFEHEANSGKASALGPVPLIRQMIVVTGILLITFLVAACSPEVTAESGDIFNSSGLKLAVNEVFLLSAAGIGAAFAALFQANRYIASGTYEMKYESSYWIRFVLGLLAGIVLASLIPIKAGGSAGGLSKPFLALLGGFSAAVVFKILSQVVGTLESLVAGDTHAVADAKASSDHAQAATQRTQDHLRVTAGLVKLREQLGSGASQEQVSAQLNAMLAELLPPDYEDDGAAAPTSPPELAPPPADGATPEGAAVGAGVDEPLPEPEPAPA